MKTFATEDEIVDDYISAMSPQDKQTWWGAQGHELIQAHHTVGRYIRNHYGLWDPKHPLVNGEHPDDVSMRIIEKVWSKLNDVDERRAAEASARASQDGQFRPIPRIEPGPR